MAHETEDSPRLRILATASRLFNSIGVHTVGIDRIIEESGVAKKTFYRQFPSKNNLIAHYFAEKDKLWFHQIKKYSADPRKKPLDNLLGVFDGLKEWFDQEDFYGCPFIRGLSDFGAEKDDPELVACIEKHFDQTQKYLGLLLQNAKVADYETFVPRLMSLIAGATIVAHATRDSSIADVNKEMARILLTARKTR